MIHGKGLSDGLPSPKTSQGDRAINMAVPSHRSAPLERLFHAQTIIVLTECLVKTHLEVLLCDEIHLEDGAAELAGVKLLLVRFDALE